jgi:hypothetical protein
MIKIETILADINRRVLDNPLDLRTKLSVKLCLKQLDIAIAEKDYRYMACLAIHLQTVKS